MSTIVDRRTQEDRFDIHIFMDGSGARIIHFKDSDDWMLELGKLHFQSRETAEIFQEEVMEIYRLIGGDRI